MSSVTIVDVEFTSPEIVDMMAPTMAAAANPRSPSGTTAATTWG